MAEDQAFLDSFDFSRDLSLYIHVPFCRSKCSYCAFYSLPGCSEAQFDGYVNRLVNEISAVNERMGHRPYETAFIGGGNPGLLGAKRLERIAKAVCANGRPAEFSTEMNPESLGEDFFPLFDRYFTRLYIGVQSLDSKALSFLGRNADMEQTLRGLELSQRLPCTLSYDLITCLGPWHDELSDVRTLVENYPSDHLSVYALTLEEGTPLYERRPSLPDSDEQYEILKRVWDFLEAQGYEHYEVSNFAKAGHRCLHNCRYWAYMPYLGLGPGAASTAFSEDGSVHRFSFRPSVSDYLSGSMFSGYEREDLTGTESAEELAFMGLRYRGGLDLARFERYANRGIDLGRLGERGDFVVRNGFLVPTDEGLMTSDAMASTIISELY